MSATEGWKVEPRPVPPELTADFTAPPFDPTLPHEHDHIDSWNSFGNILGTEGMKALMRAVL